MNWKRSIIAIVAGAPVLALLAYGFSRDPREIPTPLPGKVAPVFAAPVFAPGEAPLARNVGDTVRMGELAGNVVVLNFWASWCLACRDEHRALSETAVAYAGKPAQFLGVLYRDRTAPALAWIKDMGGQSYASLDDPRSRIAIDYGLYGVPETFIIDPKGVVAYKHIGPISESVLHKWIDSLMVRSASGDSSVRAKSP